MARNPVAAACWGAGAVHGAAQGLWRCLLEQAAAGPERDAPGSCAAGRRAMLNIIVLGEEGVGKTSLVLEWAGRAPPAGHVPAPTTGADFLLGDRVIAGQPATLAVWDLAGGAGRGEGALGSQCCALAQAAVLVYDPARPGAAASLARWAARLPDGLPRVVLASCRPDAGGGAEGEEHDARRSAVLSAVQEGCRASQTPHFVARSLADEAPIQAAFGEAARLGLRRCVGSREQQQGQQARALPAAPHLPSLERELPGAMLALLAQRCAAC